jgi:hypothetical protein
VGPFPKYKSIHALCRRVGHGIGPECFPWIARLDLVLAIMDQGESFTAFSKRIRVKHNLLTALLHEGTRLPFSHAQRVANALGQPVDDLDIAQPRQRLLGSQPPTPPDPSERYQGKTLGTPNLFRCAKVIRRLTALHLAIRNGTITPPWPHKTDSATWWQVEAEFRHAWQNHTPTGEDVAKARQTA